MALHKPTFCNVSHVLKKSEVFRLIENLAMNINFYCIILGFNFRFAELQRAKAKGFFFDIDSIILSTLLEKNLPVLTTQSDS